MRAIVAVRQGGPEVLELQQVPEPEAGPEGTLVRVRSAGVNFADALSTRGQYAASPPPPFVPGLEVAGTVVADGRPVMAILASGGYAELAVADSRLLVPADGLDLAQAGGYLLVTLTAYYGLAESVPPLGRMALIGASSGTPPEVPGFDALRRRNVGVFCFSFGMLRRADPALVAATAPRAVELLRSGKVRPPVGESLPLEQAADAHRRLTSRQTVGKVVLIP